MSAIFNYQRLKKTRIEYGISQNQLAVTCGISRQYLNSIETGRKIPSQSLAIYLYDTLERFNPDLPLTLLIDYVRIRFPTTNAKKIIEEILRLKFGYMLNEEYAFYGYQEQFVMGDIVVMLSNDEEKGVLLELKGRGCRQFENFLLAQSRSWYDFFIDCLAFGGVMKRLDLAINDRTGILDIRELTKKCQNEECISLFRSFKSYGSGELVRKQEKEGMGETLYIGSVKSEVYFCVYKKDYEQLMKLGTPLEEAEIKNRFEIRLKNERALFAVRDLIRYRNVERTAFSIINRYLRFAEKDEKKRRSQWQTNERWAWFIGKNRQELRLTTEPEPYTLERTIRWIGRQVAPTLKMAQILDKINDTTIIKDIIKRAELSKRHKKIIDQQVAGIENLIVTPSTREDG
ncbi:MobT family relaxase [Enterococcus faecalis]|uniref:MobT family relaxase n=1 Tax=Enterococcus faecalis TaxID=1351 RepID=UPI0035C9A521